MKYNYFIVIIGSLLLLTACSEKGRKKEKDIEKFQVVRPTLLDTVYTKEYVAEIQSVQNVEIRARVKGFIEKIYVDEGKAVMAGQVLFTLSSREFREDLLKAQAMLKTATAELKAVEVEIKNTSLLIDQNIISKSEMELLQARKEAALAKIDEAKSSISIANINLSFTEVKAPFTGVINRIPNKAGSLIEEGALLTTISNNKEVFAYFNISESEYLDFVKEREVGKQQQVSLIMANGGIFPHKGVVETVENEIDKGSGNLAFRARFVNPEQLLKHGSSAKILMGTALKNALVIPQKSTVEVQDKINVFVVDDSNVVRLKSFVPKFRLQHLYVIDSGLNSNDRVIYEGTQLVKEGDRIKTDLLSFSQIAGKLSRQETSN